MAASRGESELQRVQRQIVEQQNEDIKWVMMAAELEIQQEDHEIQVEMEKQDKLRAE